MHVRMSIACRRKEHKCRSNMPGIKKCNSDTIGEHLAWHLALSTFVHVVHLFDYL